MQSVMPACPECMKPLTNVHACLLADVPDSIVYAQMFFKVFNGYRPPLPDSMPAGMQKLMEACWSHNPAERPSFRFIVRALQRLIIEVWHLVNNLPSPQLSASACKEVQMHGCGRMVWRACCRLLAAPQKGPHCCRQRPLWNSILHPCAFSHDAPQPI